MFFFTLVAEVVCCMFHPLVEVVSFHFQVVRAGIQSVHVKHHVDDVLHAQCLIVGDVEQLSCFFRRIIRFTLVCQTFEWRINQSQRCA